jgi:Na+/H+ antiporter NhaA
MTGSLLPYRGGLRDSKVISTLRINRIPLLRTTGIAVTTGVSTQHGMLILAIMSGLVLGKPLGFVLA